MRAIWTGEIGFGLVAVPVKLYSATKDLAPRFHLIHKTCGSRVQMKRWCPKEDVEVPWGEIERGYEVSKGRYAVFTKEELAELEGEESAEGIDIAEFVEPAEVDLALVEKSYWVGPAGKSSRSYELLRTALERSGRIAVARVKIRTRTRLALLRPREGRFSLDMMRFGDELVPANDVEVPTARTQRSAKEIDLALDLVKRMTGHFDPKKHPDEYREAVHRAVEQKEVSAEDYQTEHAETGKVVDLADMLSRSLKGVGTTGRKKGGRGPAKKRGSRKAARRP